MSLVIDCAGDAHETLLEAQQDTKIHGDILHLLAVRDLVAGNFDSSYTFAKKALDARVALGTPQDLKTSNAYNYLGLALDSLERHDEAKSWFGKKEPILNSSDDDLYIRLRCQHDLNMSRNSRRTTQQKLTASHRLQKLVLARIVSSFIDTTTNLDLIADLLVAFTRPLHRCTPALEIWRRHKSTSSWQVWSWAKMEVSRKSAG